MPSLVQLLGSLFATVRRAGRPLEVLLLIRALEEIYRRWTARRAMQLGRLRILNTTERIDSELIQGCLLTTEDLLNLGRVEKRTLFMRPLIDVLGGNAYLVKSLLDAAHACRMGSGNCMVTRWLPPDERYHILQSSLNVMSSLFGANYVHYNAVSDGAPSGAGDHFKSTWYCLTILTPTRPGKRFPGEVARRNDEENVTDNTCTFTDMSRKPRATLRVCLCNESELRRIADGKLKPPAWGFYNNRHAERYRALEDFAKNFQKQLVRTPADGPVASARNPFTNEKCHVATPARPKPDGGLIKRVHSQPNCQGLASLASAGGLGAGGLLARANSVNLQGSGVEREEVGGSGQGAEGRDAALSEENCFLRLHVPHYVGAVPHSSSSGAGSSMHRSSSASQPLSQPLHILQQGGHGDVTVHRGSRGSLGPAQPDRSFSDTGTLGHGPMSTDPQSPLYSSRQRLGGRSDNAFR